MFLKTKENKNEKILQRHRAIVIDNNDKTMINDLPIGLLLDTKYASLILEYKLKTFNDDTWTCEESPKCLYRTQHGRFFLDENPYSEKNDLLLLDDMSAYLIITKHDINLAMKLFPNNIQIG